MTDQPLFSVDYSTDELALLADLLDVESLPLGPPRDSLSEDVRAAVSRGLVARGVLNIIDDETVEITQPHASMFAVILATRDTEASTASSPERFETTYVMKHHGLQATARSSAGATIRVDLTTVS